jgi:hypothetical protein
MSRREWKTRVRLDGMTEGQLEIAYFSEAGR